MKNIFKKTLSLTLGLALALGTLTAGSGSLANAMDSFTVKASAAEAATSGKCGDNLTWNLDDEGTLTISGTGDMYDKKKFGNESNWINYENIKNIKNIIINNGVTSIGDGAFEYFSSLTSITIPDSVTSIGEDAFFYCTSLTNITIPKGVTSINYGAFYNCINLTSIIIPKNAKHISNYAFHGCFNLESIIVKKGNTVYDSRNNCNAIIETATNTLVIGCKNTVIPESVTSIGEAAFSGCENFKSIMIPEGVASISDRAFADCTSLKRIKIPDSVTNIGDRAFANCISLNDVYYTGNEADRNTIDIKENNENLLSATWHYNSDGNDFCEDDFYEDDVDDYISETTFLDRFVSNIMDMFERVWSFIVGMFSFSFLNK